MADAYAAETTETAKAKNKTDDDILKTARERFDDCQESERTNDEEALDDLKNLAGEQWPDNVKQDREDKQRPCLTINALPQFVKQVTGDIRQNKPAIKVLPADDKSDPKLAETLTGLIRHIEQASNAQRAYIHAADGAAGCGKGWFRLTTEYSDDDGFNQDIRIRRGKNHFAARFDPAAQEADYSDGKFAFVTELIPLEEFKERYPEADTAGFDAEKTVSNTNSKDANWWDGKNVRVAEYWVKKPVTKELGLLADGTVKDLTGMKPEEVIALAPKRKRLVQSHKVCSYLITGSEILEGPMDWAGKYIPIIPVLGEEIVIGDRTVRHGLIRFAKDPQRMANYMASASAESIALQPKAPFVVTWDEIKDHKSLWDRAHLDNKPYLPYTPDSKAQGRPARQDPPNSPTALWSETERAFDNMHRTTGIYPPSLGAKSNETSGRAIMARDRQSDTGTFVYIDNVAAALTYLGRQLVDLIPKIYDTERVVRILGEDGTHEFVTVNKVTTMEGKTVTLNDLSAGEYDVVVTTGPSFATKRTEAAESMTAFMQAVPASAPLIGDLYAKNMDWPGADQISKRLKKALPPGVAEPEDGEEQAPPPPPDPMQMLAADAAKSKLEADLVESAARKAAAELQLAQVQPMGGVDPNAIATQIIDGLRAELMQGGEATAKQVQALTVILEGMLRYQAAPKSVIRGPNGEPMAVAADMSQAPPDAASALATLAQPRPIITDQAGRPVGVH